MKERKKFRRGVALFNARKFFQAHEVWEELWLLETGPEKTFLQGMIQVAAALHHYSRGNRRGTKSLLAAGALKLRLIPENYCGLALDKFRVEVERWGQLLDAGNDRGLRQTPKIHAVRPSSHKKKAEGKLSGREDWPARR